MEITEVRIKKAEGKEKLLGTASVNIDNVFVIHGIHVYVDANGEKYIQMPKSKMKDGNLKDICHPITNEVRKYFTEQIVAAFESGVAKDVVRQEDSVQ